MKRRRRTAAIVVSCVAVLASAAVVGLVIGGEVRPSSEFAGDLGHEFGVVYYDESSIELNHTFRVRNVSGRDLRIVQVASTCGCTVAETSEGVIEHGRWFDVRATLKLATPGRRAERVLLAFDDGTTLSLPVSGTAIRQSQLLAVPATVRVKRGSGVEVTLIATSRLTDVRPPDPLIECPDGVAATFVRWERVTSLDESEGQVARWQGQLQLECGESSVRGSELTVMVKLDGYNDVVGIKVEID